MKNRSKFSLCEINKFQWHKCCLCLKQIIFGRHFCRLQNDIHINIASIYICRHWHLNLWIKCTKESLKIVFQESIGLNTKYFRFQKSIQTLLDFRKWFGFSTHRFTWVSITTRCSSGTLDSLSSRCRVSLLTFVSIQSWGAVKTSGARQTRCSGLSLKRGL